MGTRNLFALLIYCFVFSLVFICLYPFYISEDAAVRREEIVVNIGGGGGQRSLQANIGYHSLSTTSRRTQSISSHPLTPIIQDCPEVPRPLLHYIPAVHSTPLTDREKLLAMCEQTQPMPLKEFFTETMMETLTKIGEGAFADVFGCQADDWTKLALKIIPIGGDFKYNDEPQSSMKTIQPETVVSLELSLLGAESNRVNRSIPHYTENFMQIYRVGLCQGKFPDFLMEAWDEYDYRKKSDNDRPDVFSDDQLYVVFAAENAGMQFGSYVYHSFDEALSILRQVAATMAVGEAALQFEHRDMHRGNILVRRTHQEVVYIRLDGKDYHIKTHGVRATVVDYTLSRIKQRECVSYNDLNKLPWLFRGKGDIQFDVYRNMKNASKAHWDGFSPYTNVLWINYLTTKTSIKGKLKHLSSTSWRRKFDPYLKDNLMLKYPSAKELFLNVFAPEIRSSHDSNSRSRH